jgi:hypothetical protein
MCIGRIQVIVATPIFVGLATDDAGAPIWTSIAPCLVSSRTSRRCAPVPHAASWTRPARGALPEGRSAPRNGPFDLTKECNLGLGSGQAAFEAGMTFPCRHGGQSRASLDMADINNWSIASAGVFQASVFRGRALSAAATAAISSALCMLRSVPLGKY